MPSILQSLWTVRPAEAPSIHIQPFWYFIWSSPENLTATIRVHQSFCKGYWLIWKNIWLAVKSRGFQCALGKSKDSRSRGELWLASALTSCVKWFLSHLFCSRERLLHRNVWRQEAKRVWYYPPVPPESLCNHQASKGAVSQGKE